MLYVRTQRLLIVLFFMNIIGLSWHHCIAAEQEVEQQDQASDLSTQAAQAADPSAAFYHDNPWMYVEKELVAVPDGQYDEIASARRFRAIIKCLCWLGTVWGSLGTLVLLCTPNDSGYNRRDNANDAVLVLAMPILMFSMLGLCALRTSEEPEYGEFNLDALKRTVNAFAADPKLIPQELISAFEALYAGYKQGGDNYLRTKGIQVLLQMKELIRNKFPQKYYRPIVNVEPQPMYVAPMPIYINR
jgi:hypothetical protein